MLDSGDTSVNSEGRDDVEDAGDAGGEVGAGEKSSLRLTLKYINDSLLGTSSDVVWCRCVFEVSGVLTA